MKQNSVNSFTEGLNFDLNPLTTPNNVLTDAVNAALITFNGDELALQNDAGNTTIDIIPDTEVLYNVATTYNTGDIVYITSGSIRKFYISLTDNNLGNYPPDNPSEWERRTVTLSDGFHPIGMKEHGGVLYIISAKLPVDNVLEWDSGTTYSEGDYVYATVLAKTYYISKQDSNTEDLPEETDEYWEVIGVKEDYNNYAGLVEIGSYPSPEAGAKQEFAGNTITYDDSETTEGERVIDLLYKPIVINGQDFKSGRYIVFTSTLTDTSNVSGYTWNVSQADYTPAFYKVKLYHQLNNGYVDLTDDIWNKYIEYKGASITGNFWFNDSGFLYYCPSQYKGKLALSLELEGLNQFKTESASFAFNVDFTFLLSVSAVGSSFISIPQAKFEVWIDDEKYDFTGNDYVIKTVANDIVELVIESIPAEKQDKILRYRVTPILEVDSTLYGEGDLPEEYVNSFTIKESRLISSQLSDIDFLIVKDNYTCDLITGRKTYNEAILTDAGGNYLAPDLTPALGTPYVFLQTDEISPTTPAAVVIAEYAVVSNSPVVELPPLETINPGVITLFEQIDITELTLQTQIDCGVIEVVTPVYVGVTDTGVPYLIEVDGNAVVIGSGQLSSASYAKHTCVAYSADDNLLFVGGDNGTLHIYDVSDPADIQSKSITVFSGTASVSCVDIIDSPSKQIFIGKAATGGDAYKLPYYSSFSSYVDNDTLLMGDASTDWTRGFLYYDSYYYAASRNGTMYRTDDIFTSWTLIQDDDPENYVALEQSTNYIWALDQGNTLWYTAKTDPLTWFQERTDISYQRDIIPLDGDNIAIINAVDYSGIWEKPGTGAETKINEASIKKAGGGFYDEVTYAYFGVQDSSNDYKIAKFDTGTSAWSYVATNALFYKLFSY